MNIGAPGSTLKNEMISSYRKRVKDALYVEDMRDEMVSLLKTGFPRGATTYFPPIDRRFLWIKQHVVVFGGIGGHGKSKVVKQLCLIKSIKEGVKWAIHTPEEYPAYTFYNDLIHTLTGKDPMGKTPPDEESYVKALDFLGDHFIYIYPEERPTPKSINESFKQAVEIHGVVGVITDPFTQLSKDMEGKSHDQYLSSFLYDERKFAIDNNVYKIIVAHPNSTIEKAGKIARQEGRDYECPDPSQLHGGQMWNNSADDIIMIHRPTYNSLPDNPAVLFWSKKIKKQAISGKLGHTTLYLDIWKNRYFYVEELNNAFVGTSPFGEIDVDAERAAISTAGDMRYF